MADFMAPPFFGEIRHYHSVSYPPLGTAKRNPTGWKPQSSRLNPGTKAKLSSAKVATNKTSTMSRSPACASHMRIDPQHLG